LGDGRRAALGRLVAGSLRVPHCKPNAHRTVSKGQKQKPRRRCLQQRQKQQQQQQQQQEQQEQQEQQQTQQTQQTRSARCKKDGCEHRRE